MPDRRLTQLPVLAALSADDIFYVVDDPAGAASSRQVATSVFDARYLQTANNLSDLTNVVVARASLGLGTLAVINSPLPIINGGSGQVTQQAAIDALTNVAAATNEHVLTKDTATGNAIFKVTATVLPVVDTTAIVKGSVTDTKQLRFEVDGFTAATTRVATWPNADITVAGLEVAQTFTAAQTVTVNNAVTNAITVIATLDHDNTGAAALANFGTGLLLRGKTSTNSNQNMAQVATYWTNPAHGNRSAAIGFYTVNLAGALAERMTIQSDGRLSVAMATRTDTSGSVNVVNVTGDINASGASSVQFSGLRFVPQFLGTQNYTDNLYGALISPTVKTSGTVASAQAIFATVDTENAGGNVSSVMGVNTRIRNLTAGRTIVAARGFNVTAPTATGTITTFYGLYMDALTQAGTNYAILTNAGNVVFNEAGDASTDFRVEGDTDADLLFTDASADAVGVGINTPGAKLHIDQLSTTAAKPVLTVDQADVSEEFIRFIGTSANGVLTQSIVENADVGAATLQGWLKVFVQDDGNQLADQAYFVPIYTLA